MLAAASGHSIAKGSTCGKLRPWRWCKPPRAIALEAGPPGTRTSSAELFYLHHRRSCAASASGAQSQGAKGPSPRPAVAPLLISLGPCLDFGLDIVFVLTSLQCNFLLRSLLFVIERPGSWAPAVFACLAHPPLSEHGTALQLCALVSGDAVPWMAVQAVLLGSWRAPVGIVALAAYACDVHVQLRWCRLASAGVAFAGIPGWGTGAGTAWAAATVGAAWWRPAFPDAGPPPPAPHPEPRPAARELRVTSWGVDVLANRRSCYCHVESCKGPIRRGNLWAFSTALAHKLYYHPECVEGGLGPYDNVAGTDQLTDAQKDTVRDLCDRPGRPTREQFVEDVRSAKRARQQGTDGGGAPLQGADDGDPGELPETLEGDAGNGPQADLPNLSWWDSVSYDSLAHDVPTVVKVPDETARALAALRGRVAETLLNAYGAGDATTQHRAEKLFTFFDRLMLHRNQKQRGGKATKGRGLSQALISRLRLAERGDWAALWRAAHAPGTRPPGRSGRRPTPERAAQQAETLVKEGLVSKAMTTVARPTTPAQGSGVYATLENLFPTGAPATWNGPEPQPLDEDLQNELLTAVKDHVRRAPRRSGPGPNGSRFEHWRTLLCDTPALEACARVVVLFLYGQLSPGAMEANLGARLVALRKPNGGIRPIACGGVLRRLAGRAACAVFGDSIKAGCGRFQYAVGRPAGCELVHKTIAALTEANPRGVILAFDAKNAFNSVPRQQVLDSVAVRAPDLGPTAAAWLGRTTTHLFWNDNEDAARVRATSGVDQGCPLSPALFAIAIAGALDEIHAALQTLSPVCKVFSYLDDVMVFTPPEHAAAADQIVAETLLRHGLQVQQDKTQAWTKDANAALPPTLRERRVPHLKCLGNAAPWLDQEEERIRVHAGTDGAAAVAKAVRFGYRLRELRAAGLSAGATFTLLRTYAQGAVTHHLRASRDLSWVDQFDQVVFGCLEELIGAALDPQQRAQATMRLKDGGISLPSARTTSSAAYAASWALTMKEVARAAGFQSWEDFRAQCPLTHQALMEADADLRAQGAISGDFDWLGCFQEPTPKLQGTWGKARSAATRAKLLRELGEDDRLALRGAGGTGAGSFVLPSEEGDPNMPDKHFITSVKLRLRCDVCPQGAVCQHRRQDGTICGAPLDRRGWHARCCGVGQSRTARHDRMRDWHAKLHTSLTGFAATTEQLVPAWDRVNRRTGLLEAAKLDVATTDPSTGRPVFVDWSITCEYSEYAPRRQARSNNDGAAAAAMVREKRDRYPPSGGDLAPLVFETLGRPSDEAAEFIRAYGQNLGEAERGEVLARVWRQLSRHLQRGNAEMVLSAIGQ